MAVIVQPLFPAAPCIPHPVQEISSFTCLCPAAAVHLSWYPITTHLGTTNRGSETRRNGSGSHSRKAGGLRHADGPPHCHYCLLNLQKEIQKPVLVPWGHRWERQPPLWWHLHKQMRTISTRVVCKVQKEGALLKQRDTTDVCYGAGTPQMLHEGWMHTWKAAFLSKAQAWTKSWDSPADVARVGLVGQQAWLECVLCARALGWTGVSELGRVTFSGTELWCHLLGPRPPELQSSLWPLWNFSEEHF